MRWGVAAVFGLTLATPAFAADLDILRGSIPTYNWGGFYGGVQAGYSSAEINSSQSASADIAFLLRDTAIEQDQDISAWTVLGNRTPTATNYGGFIGYNSVWEDVILGGEINYSHGSLFAISTDSISRSFVDSTNLPAGHNYFYNVTVAAQSSIRITDIATFRGRAGWQAGIFLPYGFVGVAVGRADVANSGTVSYTAIDEPDLQTPPTPQLTPLAPLSFDGTQTNGQNGAFMYGFTTGLGLDVALMSNVFVRGEVEYIYFAPVDGTQVSLWTGRVGAAYKF
jgi:outer membrane immunogenic protein